MKITIEFLEHHFSPEQMEEEIHAIAKKIGARSSTGEGFSWEDFYWKAETDEEQGWAASDRADFESMQE